MHSRALREDSVWEAIAQEKSQLVLGQFCTGYVMKGALVDDDVVSHRHCPCYVVATAVYIHC